MGVSEKDIKLRYLNNYGHKGQGTLFGLASMIKADIHSRFPKPYVSMYCQQFDNFKNVADFFDFAAKMIRR